MFFPRRNEHIMANDANEPLMQIRQNTEIRIRESQRRFEETAELLPGIICESD